MKRALLYSGIALVAGAFLIRLLQYDPGYVLIQAYGKSIEMRFGMVLALIVVAVLLVWLLVKLCKGLVYMIRGPFSYTRAKRREASARRTHRGLVEYLEGDHRRAVRDLVKGAKGADDRLVHYLAAARSAHELGDDEGARALLQKAAAEGDGARIAVGLSQARLELESRKYEQALATLTRLSKEAEGHPAVLELLAETHLHLRDYRALEALLPTLERSRVLSEARMQGLAAEAYLGQLRELERKLAQEPALAAGTEGEGSARAELDGLWRRVPRQVAQLPALQEGYVALLLRTEQHDNAYQQARQALKGHWWPAMVDLFGLCRPRDPARHWSELEGYLKQHPDDARLHLAAGRVLLANQRWDEAKEHFRRSLQLEPAAETYAELGRLLAYLGERDESLLHYQRGLMLTTQGLPDLPMPSQRPGLTADSVGDAPPA